MRLQLNIFPLPITLRNLQRNLRQIDNGSLTFKAVLIINFNLQRFKTIYLKDPVHIKVLLNPIIKIFKALRIDIAWWHFQTENCVSSKPIL